MLAILRRDAPRTVGYLLAAIRNRFIDILRRKKRVDFRRLGDGETPPALTLLGEPDETVDPERMQRALGELSPYEREVLFLAYVVEYTAQEIADLMACPRGTVLSLMHRTRKKMHALLTRDPEDA